MNIGIIFDLDGTLWDSAENVAKSWNIALERKYPQIKLTAQDIKNQMGKVMTEIADNLFSSLEPDERYRLLSECEKCELDYIAKHGGVLFEGVEDTFRLLSSKYKLFIVSNCQDGYIETFIRHYHFEQYITDIESFGNTGLPKADNIKIVIERNHLKKAFYVGDTKGDMRSSDMGGSTFIHAAYGFDTLDEVRPCINDIRELPDMIQSL